MKVTPSWGLLSLSSSPTICYVGIWTRANQKGIPCLCLFLSFFGLRLVPWSYFPDQGTSTRSLQWKCGVLNTGPPGKSLFVPFHKLCPHSGKLSPSGKRQWRQPFLSETLLSSCLPFPPRPNHPPPHLGWLFIRLIIYIVVSLILSVILWVILWGKHRSDLRPIEEEAGWWWGWGWARWPRFRCPCLRALPPPLNYLITSLVCSSWLVFPTRFSRNSLRVRTYLSHLHICILIAWFPTKK